MLKSLSKPAILLVGLLLTGCGAIHHENIQIENNRPVAPELTTEQSASIEALREALLSLAGDISATDAEFIARDAHLYPLYLANHYKLQSPALLHNGLVNAGAKDRGLCYHWTHDLVRYFRSKNLQSVTFHWAAAFIGSGLREHNVAVVSAKGKGIEDGIVLDPWRKSAKLFWARVPDDKKYPWELIETYSDNNRPYRIDYYEIPSYAIQ
jgi:hypothetical protein